MQAVLISNYLANLRVELFMAHHNKVDLQWRDLNYTPDYSKFYYICEGEGWVRIGDREYKPEAGQLVLMPEGVRQSYAAISEHTYSKYWCHFGAYVGDLNLFQLVELPHVWEVPDRDYVEQLMRSIVVNMNAPAMQGMLLAKSKLMELVAYCVSQTNTGQIALKNVPAIDKLAAVLDYIHAHIEREITVRELAEVARMHPNYLIRLFKRHMGAPPIQFIMRKKMEKAKHLLACTPLTVSEVAEQVGFRDLFHFSKQFKKHTRLTPTAYRRQSGMSGGIA